jgi:hypothetical protein
MKTVRNLTGTLRSIHNTKQAQKQTRFIIKKRYAARPMFYRMTLWGYVWDRNRDEATVFPNRRMLDAELVATTMAIYDHYEIIQV